MTDLAGKCAVVTGATQGIGHAIAAALHNAGVRLVLLGRSRDRLQAAIRDFPSTDQVPRPYLVEADLHDLASLDAAVDEISTIIPALDILVNCGGAYLRGGWEEIDPGAFENLMATNVIGPFALTRLLLPQLAAARGDVVFVNSSITRSPGTRASHYKATQHALKSMTDSLRAEINEKGVRVLSLYPGRTATPRQESIHADESKDYLPDALLQPPDVADSVLFCLSLPDTAEVTDLYIRPRRKS